MIYFSFKILIEIFNFSYFFTLEKEIKVFMGYNVMNVVLFSIIHFYFEIRIYFFVEFLFSIIIIIVLFIIVV